jgi:hypothetical protein
MASQKERMFYCVRSTTPSACCQAWHWLKPREKPVLPLGLEAQWLATGYVSVNAAVRVASGSGSIRRIEAAIRNFADNARPCPYV